jgi:Ca2+-binding EF-hand superfamily protein
LIYFIRFIANALAEENNKEWAEMDKKWLEEQRREFREMDENRDGLLTRDELLVEIRLSCFICFIFHKF